MNDGNEKFSTCLCRMCLNIARHYNWLPPAKGAAILFHRLVALDVCQA